MARRKITTSEAISLGAEAKTIFDSEAWVAAKDEVVENYSREMLSPSCSTEQREHLWRKAQVISEVEDELRAMYSNKVIKEREQKLR